MDILSFALYHENNNVIDDKHPSLSDKRKRDEPVTPEGSDAEDHDTDGNKPKRQREESGPAAAYQVELQDVKRSIYEEVSKSLEDSVNIEDVCNHNQYRSLVSRAVKSLEY